MSRYRTNQKYCERSNKAWAKYLGRLLQFALAEKIAKKYGKADLVICNNVYAHVPDINDFTKALKESLKDELW